MILETDSMNATERFKTTISHKEPDRVPIFLTGVHPYSKVYIELMQNYDEILDEWTEDEKNLIITPIGDFTIRYFLGSELEHFSIGLNDSFTNKIIDENNKIIGDLTPKIKQEAIQNYKEKQKNTEINNKQNYILKYVDHHGRIMALTILPTGHEYTWYIGGYLKTEKEILDWYDTYGWPHEFPVRNYDINAYKETCSKYGDRICFVPHNGGPQLFESLWPMMGMAKFGYFCRKKPELIHKLVETRKLAQLKILNEIKKLNPIAVYGGDDLGQKGRSLISPEIFRKFFKNAYKEIFDKVHEMNAIAYNHGDGNFMELLPDYIEAGLDGWQALEPDSLIDHELLKKKFGDKLVLIGGLNQNYMTRPDVGPEQVEKHVKEQIKKMASNGGYIAGPSHDYLNVPLKNALALRDAIYKYGKYPINY